MDNLDKNYSQWIENHSKLTKDFILQNLSHLEKTDVGFENFISSKPKKNKMPRVIRITKKS